MGSARAIANMQGYAAGSRPRGEILGGLYRHALRC
jgi:hypothetical protein